MRPASLIAHKKYLADLAYNLNPIVLLIQHLTFNI